MSSKSVFGDSNYVRRHIINKNTFHIVKELKISKLSRIIASIAASKGYFGLSPRKTLDSLNERRGKSTEGYMANNPTLCAHPIGKSLSQHRATGKNPYWLKQMVTSLNFTLTAESICKLVKFSGKQPISCSSGGKNSLFQQIKLKWIVHAS